MRRVLIMGAAGRDFHNFNVVFRNNPSERVICFTAAQIPHISGRRYPPVLAGRHYPKGIPIYPEDKLDKLIKKHKIDDVVLSYSDLSFTQVMEKASQVLAAGASFRLLGPEQTMLKSRKPVIAVTAVRTGCGKSPTTRHIVRVLRQRGLNAVVVRHPMPYGILSKQVCERFATYKDLDRYKTTIEEREEYEPLIDNGAIVYAGVDYEKILRQAEQEADSIIWDGGNNDTPFYQPDLWITIADPLRPGHEITYYPGEVNVRRADILIINKESSASQKNIEVVRRNLRSRNPTATIIDADSRLTVSGDITGKKVLVIEDGPTITHGGVPTGAGYVAALRHGARPIDPRPFAKGSLKELYARFPHIGKVLPAIGYYPEQLRELEHTINTAECDAVVSATPIDLRRIIAVAKPIVKISYELDDKGALEKEIDKWLKKRCKKKSRKR